MLPLNPERMRRRLKQKLSTKIRQLVSKLVFAKYVVGYIPTTCLVLYWSMLVVICTALDNVVKQILVLLLSLNNNDILIVKCILETASPSWDTGSCDGLVLYLSITQIGDGINNNCTAIIYL